jgi:nucleotide-binding universal stress UspA family protein
MLKSILLVLDDQPLDHGAVELAIRWSVDCDALLVGLGVIDESAVNPAEAVPLGAGQSKVELDAARMHERRLEIGGALSAIALKCGQANAAFKPLESIGSAIEGILVEAQRFDVIVMPRLRIAGAANQWNVSDPLYRILWSTPRPVVAVPDELPRGDAIVVAYDGSVQSARAVYALAASGLAVQRPVHVIAVHDDPIEAARCGNRAVEFLGSHDVRATLCAKSEGRPADQILALARDVDAGLLVLGVYGKPRIQEFFLGSVTSTMLAECPLPLFLFH